MTLNPYAEFLGSSDPLTSAAETPARLASIMSKLPGEAMLRPPAPGKWSARQVLCHLADCEIAFAFRFRQTLAEPGHTMQPFFDQDLWARSYAAYPAEIALATFLSLRHWNLTLLKSLPEEAFLIEATHPERGTMTLQTIVETMAGHDRNHLAQLDAIAASA